MTATRAERFQTMRDSVSSAIMDAAGKLFAERGFEAVSVRQLAQAAGISQGLLYNYYPSKEAVLQAIVQAGVQAILQTFGPPNPDASPAERIALHIRQSFSMLRAQRNFWKLIHRLRMQPAVLAALAPDMPAIALALHQAVRTNAEAAGAQDPDAEAHLLIAAIDGVTAQYLMHEDEPYLDRMTDYLIHRFTANLSI